MPYPVSPPEPPAIVHTLPAQDIAPTWEQINAAPIAESTEPATPVTLEELPEQTFSPEPTNSAELLGPPVARDLSDRPSEQVADFDSSEAVIVGFTNPEPRVSEPTEELASKGTGEEFSFTTYHLAPVDREIQNRDRDSSELAQGTPEALPTEVPGNAPEPITPDPIEPQNPPQLEIPTPEETPPPAAKPRDRTQPQPPPRRTPAPTPQTPPTRVPSGSDTVEIKADRQEFDDRRQIVTAIGNVIVRFQQAVIDADKAEVNLLTRQVVAEGNVAYRRGQQVVRGDRMEYNLGLSSGAIEQARGELFIPTAGSDLAPTLPTDISAGGLLDEPLSDRILSQQPVRGIRATPGANVVIGGRRGQFFTFPQVFGTVNRVRFEAERLDIQPDGTRV
ncbi:MAG TPA: LptA/OstA family protein, partial [Kamptonema sp.]|nr:LptA/OstA family protein [Kamptonema sp.]